MKLKFKSIFFLLLCLLFSGVSAEKIKVGSLQYGSVNWELKLIKDLGLDEQNGFSLEIIELASKNAAAVALQGGAVDLIVTDWFWVSRQRNEKRLFAFVPHSMAAGGLIASKDSKISNDLDLKEKKIGIAGGQVDKGWLIFRAFYKKKYGTDLIKMSDQIFGAPPLLNKKIEQKAFDAILTYWPYQAKLLTNNEFEKVISINDILGELGIPNGMPVIGWVFKEKWANKNGKILNKFLDTSDLAKKMMLESNDIWKKIRPFMNAENDQIFVNLRDIYREGIPKKEFTKEQLKGTEKLYSILAEIGGKDLVGNAKVLSPGTFWGN
ncbi:MAG: ABC transporter substrate-binding protein [Alphaproteobacteria bacterium]